jgi:hypothetical protein
MMQRLSSSDPYKSRASQLTSRRAATTGNPSRPGSLGAVPQYKSGAEIIRMPAGSIVSLPPLEPLDPAQPRFNEALVLALLFNCLLWFGFALILRALFF